MNNRPAVQIDGVSKKFAHSLKSTMVYGLRDIAADAMGRTRSGDTLRRGFPQSE